jgi:hypothetical protein
LYAQKSGKSTFPYFADIKYVEVLCVSCPEITPDPIGIFPRFKKAIDDATQNFADVYRFVTTTGTKQR